jgi:O-succinylbenzoate synthase
MPRSLPKEIGRPSRDRVMGDLFPPQIMGLKLKLSQLRNWTPRILSKRLQKKLTINYRKQQTTFE